MTEKDAKAKMRQFIHAYVELKKGEIVEESNDVFSVKYPDQSSPVEYTYEPIVAREKKSLFLTPGSPAFQQILKECLDGGIVSQIKITVKGSAENLLKKVFTDLDLPCQSCPKNILGGEVSICQETAPCTHKINNAKMLSCRILKEEPARYFLFYFNVTFQNKLRPRSEELITIPLDENGNTANFQDFKDYLSNAALEIQDYKSKLKPQIFDILKPIAASQLDAILEKKVVLFDLPLLKEKKAKLKGFEKRIRRTHLEQLISKKTDFDQKKWQANCEELQEREEETLTTHITTKFVSLLIVNTAKVSFQINLDNKAAITSSIILGVNHAVDVVCPICRNKISQGYATSDSFYVCKDCVKQSVDTGNIYSKKATLKLDESLNEYIEQSAGFVCSVCGKKHSRLLEYKCSHDNSSICIYHYGLCDYCGKIFSNLNLISSHEFKRKLCPKHAVKCEGCQSVFGIDEIKLDNASGKKLCPNCTEKKGIH